MKIQIICGHKIHFQFRRSSKTLFIEYESLLEITSSSDLKIKFELLRIEEFWILTESDYKKLSIKAITKLLLFATSYSFKTGFLVYLH